MLSKAALLVRTFFSSSLLELFTVVQKFYVFPVGQLIFKKILKTYQTLIIDIYNTLFFIYDLWLHIKDWWLRIDTLGLGTKDWWSRNEDLGLSDSTFVGMTSPALWYLSAITTLDTFKEITVMGSHCWRSFGVTDSRANTTEILGRR